MKRFVLMMTAMPMLLTSVCLAQEPYETNLPLTRVDLPFSLVPLYAPGGSFAEVLLPGGQSDQEVKLDGLASAVGGYIAPQPQWPSQDPDSSNIFAGIIATSPVAYGSYAYAPYMNVSGFALTTVDPIGWVPDGWIASLVDHNYEINADTFNEVGDLCTVHSQLAFMYIDNVPTGCGWGSAAARAGGWEVWLQDWGGFIITGIDQPDNSSGPTFGLSEDFIASFQAVTASTVGTKYEMSTTYNFSWQCLPPGMYNNGGWADASSFVRTNSTGIPVDNEINQQWD